MKLIAVGLVVLLAGLGFFGGNGQQVTVNLYFADAGSFCLIPEPRVVEGENMPLAVLEALLAGPSADGLISLIPMGVKVQALVIRDKTAYVDFSTEINNVNYGSGPEAAMLTMIVNTLTELEGIDAVYITADGRIPECFHHIGSSGPFSWSGALLKDQ